MTAQREILQVLKTHTAYDITERFLNFQPILKLIAEQGGLRSYIIYLLYSNGKTNFWKIVDETGFSRRHVDRVLKQLKNEEFIDHDAEGDWFLIDKPVSS